MKTSQQSYPALASALGLKNEVYLKREDQHHFGSHKARSIPLMIDLYRKSGVTNFVISSSGNAALAAILAIQSHNRNAKDPLKLAVFVGMRIAPEKLALLQSVIEDTDHVIMKQVENPKRQAFQIDKSGSAKSLRQSTDDNALLGYEELAHELSRIPNLAAVFIPTSSGTTAQALGEYFLKNELPIQIHIVQTTTCHPIVSALLPDVGEEATYPLPLVGGAPPAGREGVVALPRSSFNATPDSEPSLATAIVDHVAHRKQRVADVIKNSEGSGWIVSNEEIEDAIKLVEETANILISPNSALSTAGLAKAIGNRWKWNGPVCCILTGR